MKTPIGTSIQGLERLLIENLKETELIEHPHIYHGDLRKKDEPISLSYKVAEVYRTQGEYYDPLFEIFPLIDILRKQYAGTIEIGTSCDEATRVRTIRLRLEYCPHPDVMQFKFEVLLDINRVISDYLRQIGKRPKERKTHGMMMDDFYTATDAQHGRKKKKKRKGK